MVLMIISDRKKKKYSEKLFNELCFFVLLINSENKAYIYVLDKKLNKSRRTLYRYAEDLYLNGIIPNLITKKIEKYKYFYIPNIRKENCYELVDYLCSYIERNKNTVLSSKQHKNKLYRLCLLIIENIFSFMNIKYFSKEQETYDYLTKIGENKYAFETFTVPNHLYKDVSLRTQEREVKIVKDVISYMCEG